MNTPTDPPLDSPVEAVATLTDDDLRLVPTSGADRLLGWSVEVAGERRGTIALREDGGRTWSARWNTGTGPDAMSWAVRSLRLAVEHAFSVLGAVRVECRIPVDRPDDVRAASIGGLRREGIVRGAGDLTDRALMARLVDDPPASSREGFIALLNAGLPTKRVISQGLLRDHDGRVLLCRLTYKSEWDLPGGVVEVGESPAEGLVRELREELGLTLSIRGLVTVNWLPAWRGWDDACVFLFDLGTVDREVVDTMTFQPTEIVGVEWTTAADRAGRATAAAQEVLAAVLPGLDGDGPPAPAFREAPLAPE